MRAILLIFTLFQLVSFNVHAQGIGSGDPGPDSNDNGECAILRTDHDRLEFMFLNAFKELYGIPMPKRISLEQALMIMTGKVIDSFNSQVKVTVPLFGDASKSCPHDSFEVALYKDLLKESMLGHLRELSIVRLNMLQQCGGRELPENYNEVNDLIYAILNGNKK